VFPGCSKGSRRDILTTRIITVGTDDEIARRKMLTFEQAEGLEPLPTQLGITEVSRELRAVLWNYIEQQIKESGATGTFGRYVADPWASILKAVHVYRDHRTDEFSTTLTPTINQVRTIFEQGSYAQIYGWLQFVIRALPNSGFSKKIESLLRYSRAPYRVVDGTVLLPIGSEAEAQTISNAFSDLASAQLTGAREHLRNAATELNQGQFADSVRESIHAVESVARTLQPSGELSGALARLEKTAQIHGAMKKGFTSLYGYTSDSQGIRHALLEKGAPEVDEHDALFMIGACAAFVSYLVNKARKAGLLST